jgi:transposase-like protein
MAKRASQAGDAGTTDRTSAGRLGTGLSPCGKRRRWTAEQKHEIVADGMEPDASAAIVAGRHGISTGQFYAWRQQLLLRGAFGAGTDTIPGLAGIDAATSAPHLAGARGFLSGSRLDVRSGGKQPRSSKRSAASGQPAHVSAFPCRSSRSLPAGRTERWGNRQ